MSNDKEVIAFSADQQCAVIGHCFRTPALWAELEAVGLTKEWIVDPPLAALYGQVEAFAAAYDRRPTPAEVIQYVSNKEEPEYVGAAKRALERAAKASAHIGWDVLRPKLLTWKMARIIVQEGMTANKEFNAGKHADAVRTMIRCGKELEHLLTLKDSPLVQTSATRIDGERAERLERGKAMLPYGVSYLDDALLGITKGSLILVGARTGSGKTDFVTALSRTNAAAGKRVTFFAMEAERLEIERRMKFAVVARLYYAADHEKQPEPISYREWYAGVIDHLTGPYEDEAEAEVKAATKTLWTRYRAIESFGVADLERELAIAAQTSDLVIFDHLHHLDSKAGAEIDDQKAAVRALAAIKDRYGCPIVVLGQFRKPEGRRNAPLLPDEHDFRGSSDLANFATDVIVFGAAEDVAINTTSSDKDRAEALEQMVDDQRSGLLAPTFIRIPKSRLGGEVKHWTAVQWYDFRRRTYLNEYATGRLTNGDTVWEPCFLNGATKRPPPRWAKRGTIGVVDADD